MKYITIKAEPHREIRCSNCRALIGKENTPLGSTQIKCSRCGEINTVVFRITAKHLLQIIVADEEAKAELVKLIKEGGDDHAKK